MVPRLVRAQRDYKDISICSFYHTHTTHTHMHARRHVCMHTHTHTNRPQVESCAILYFSSIAQPNL